MAQDGFSELRPAPRVMAAARIGVGLIQGVILYALTRAETHGGWGATDWLLTALLLTAIVMPLVFIGGLGSLRRSTLLIWTGVAGLLAFALGAYDTLRAEPASSSHGPSEMLMLATGVLIFIAHHLVAGADADRRIVARYPTYFDLASKHGVQIALAGLFVGVFWAVMFLGAGLFKLIGIDALMQLVRHEGFAMPATTTMFAVGVQLTDVRVALIRGVRAIALLLLAWLTPLLALLAAAFLLALPFTGLKPLFDTRSAASILLAAAALLIVLINAAYQDGKPEHPPALILRWAARLAAVLIAPLVGIAGYAVMLRVGQYGLTPERVLASACVAVGSICAVGYLIAAVRPGPWMKTLEPTNVVAAIAAVVTLLALFTPLADPARLSVDDQLRRLARGAVQADGLDYVFLRFEGGRYGLKALKKLAAGSGPAAEGAKKALARKDRYEVPAMAAPTPEQRRAQIIVYPKGATLPDDFYTQDWSDPGIGQPCLVASTGCDAYIADLDADGRSEVLLREGEGAVIAYRKTEGGLWRGFAQIDLCGDAKDLRAGTFKVVRPRWMALQIGGEVYQVPARPSCSEGVPAVPPPQMWQAGKLPPEHR